MVCDHKRIKCVNCEFFCADCGMKIKITYPRPEGTKTIDLPEIKSTKKKGAKGK